MRRELAQGKPREQVGVVASFASFSSEERVPVRVVVQSDGLESASGADGGAQNAEGLISKAVVLELNVLERGTAHKNAGDFSSTVISKPSVVHVEKLETRNGRQNSQNHAATFPFERVAFQVQTDEVGHAFERACKSARF